MEGRESEGKEWKERRERWRKGTGRINCRRCSSWSPKLSYDIVLTAQMLTASLLAACLCYMHYVHLCTMCNSDVLVTLYVCQTLGFPNRSSTGSWWSTDAFQEVLSGGIKTVYKDRRTPQTATGHYF